MFLITCELAPKSKNYVLSKSNALKCAFIVACGSSIPIIWKIIDSHIIEVIIQQALIQSYVVETIVHVLTWTWLIVAKCVSAIVAFEDVEDSLILSICNVVVSINLHKFSCIRTIWTLKLYNI